MKRSSQFMVLTIAFDIVLIGLLNRLALPGNPLLWLILALFIISPLLTAVIIYPDTLSQLLTGQSSNSK